MKETFVRMSPALSEQWVEEDTGRIIRNDKRVAISENSAKLLTRLNIPHDNWLKLTTECGKLKSLRNLYSDPNKYSGCRGQIALTVE